MKLLNKWVLLALAIGLVVGFFAGMEYKAYQVRSAFQSAFSATPAPEKQETAMQQAKKENMVTISKAVGDDIVLSALSLKITGVEEKQIINSTYSSPKTAKQGTKFVVISMDVTNTTNSAFSFSPDDGLLLVDDKAREFQTYSDSIGSIDNYLNYKELSPSIKQSGVLVYEIPSDAKQYSLVTSKAGSKELYKIILK